MLYVYLSTYIYTVLYIYVYICGIYMCVCGGGGD